MPRKVVARSLRETPEARAQRAAILEELSVALELLPEMTPEQAKRARKREKRFARDEAAALKRWKEASPEWRLAECARFGTKLPPDEDTGALFAMLAAYEQESARDAAKAERAEAARDARPATMTSAGRGESDRNEPMRAADHGPTSAGEEAAAPAPRPKRSRTAGVAGYLDPRLWD